MYAMGNMGDAPKARPGDQMADMLQLSPGALEEGLFLMKLVSGKLRPVSLGVLIEQNKLQQNEFVQFHLCLKVRGGRSCMSTPRKFWKIPQT